MYIFKWCKYCTLKHTNTIETFYMLFMKIMYLKHIKDVILCSD